MRRVVTIVGATILVLAIVSQFVLPAVVEQRLRDRLHGAARGHLHVEVEAFPAIELLFDHADRVTVSMDRYDSMRSRLEKLIGATARADRVDARVGELHAQLLTLRHVTLRKRGRELEARALVTRAAIRDALPSFVTVEPVASGGGQLVLGASVTLFGLRAAVNAHVLPLNGALVLVPDVPFGSFVSLTIFSNRRVFVEGVDARPAPGGFAVSARARFVH
ncbi:MAG TPA: hypothetical protein VHE14_06865 [Solirubrobacteraceae bacterium]|nr:hypothetical protein [Solirubrobacteraceae bacterium]